jgi:MarR family transcriptional regulator, 2-MHQ and catechol-resistance regulon repressor
LFCDVQRIADEPGAVREEDRSEHESDDGEDRRGLIRRHAHPTDRRNRVSCLTGAGKKLIEKAFQEHASVMEDIGKSLSPEERAVLIELLKRLGKGAEEH